jgi:hypothetical protein
MIAAQLITYLQHDRARKFTNTLASRSAISARHHSDTGLSGMLIYPAGRPLVGLSGEVLLGVGRPRTASRSTWSVGSANNSVVPIVKIIGEILIGGVFDATPALRPRTMSLKNGLGFHIGRGKKSAWTSGWPREQDRKFCPMCRKCDSIEGIDQVSQVMIILSYSQGRKRRAITHDSFQRHPENAARQVHHQRPSTAMMPLEWSAGTPCG